MVCHVGPLGRFWSIVAKSLARFRIVAVVGPKLPPHIIGHCVGVDQRHPRVFEVARTLKGIARLADADPWWLECYVQVWHRIGIERRVIDRARSYTPQASRNCPSPHSFRFDRCHTF